MLVSGSPDITSLDIEVIWDISGTLPLISITNLSTGSGLANTTTWFVATSPTNTFIHEGSESTPDETGIWATSVLNDAWPRPFNSIEFSGAPYNLTMYVKDSTGGIYSISKQVSICRPAGNTSLSKNPYGVATLNLQVKCEQARIWFEDTTNHVYKGLEGTQITSVLRVVYPIDETGTIPDPFVMADFSTALVPITYSSDNYQFLFTTIYDYDFGDNAHVRIKYQSRSKNGAAAISFAVLCNIDLCPLVCEVQKLMDSITSGNCSDVTDAQRKLSLINPKLLLCFLGKQEPLCGIDVPALIEEIKEIGGFVCDCCNAPTGIIPTTSSVIDGYNFIVNPVCGDVSGNFSVNGANITLNIQDISYQFQFIQNSPTDTTAFTIGSDVNGCTKTFYLMVDATQLSSDLLNIIANDGDLVNLFNSIVIQNSSSQLIVDGGCIFQSTSTCDYVFTLSNIPINTTFALLSSIKIGANNITLSYAFNLTNLAGLQGYLNGLGYGTFVVTNPSGQTVLITTTTNANDIQGLNYKISGTTFPAAMERNCTGYVAIDANEVVQNMINYLCDLDDTQVVTSQDYIINFIDSDGVSQTVTVAAGSTLADFIIALLTANNSTVDNVGEATEVSCTTVKAAFDPNNNDAITGADFLMGTRGGGACAQINYGSVFLYMLGLISTNTTIREAFCNGVTLCGAGLACAPYNFFEAIVTTYDEACAPIVGIEYTFS